MTAAERETRILSLEVNVRELARRRRGLVPLSVSLDDMTSAAWVGAIKAVDDFDSSLGVPLSAYADIRIRSEILDYLRSVDPLSRDHRQQVRRGECSAPHMIRLDASVLDPRRPERSEPMKREIADPRAGDPVARLEAAMQLTWILKHAELRPRYERILWRWINGEMLKTIAHDEHVNASRATQIRTKALQQLRQAA